VDEKSLYIFVLEPLLTTAKQFRFIHSDVWKEKMRFIFVQNGNFPLPTGVFPTFNSPYYLLLLN